VKNAIAHRKMLLVIDDAWDLNAANLLKCGGPNCAHLLTTRNQEIAHAFAGPQGTRNIPALEESAAFEMLKALAPAVCEADPETGQKLAEAVGGLPLALELLGRYLAPQERSAFPRLSAEAFSDMADPNRRLELAQHRLGDIASSEKPLSEIIGLSLEDLPEEAVNAFHALGAFASKPESFDLDAAVAVAGVNAQTLDLLNSRSLMEKIGERFSLHQTLADLARQKMPSEASNRHWDHYLALINENREDWQRIESEYPQIKWAWGKAEKSERLLDMIYALRIYRVRRGLWHDELDWSNIGLKIFEEHGMRGRSATLLNNIGMAYDSLGQQDKALEFFNQALPVIHEEGNRTGLAVTLNNIAGVYFAQGRQEQGLEFLNQALGIREEAGDRAGVATTLNNIGMAHSSLGRQEKALEFFEKALPIRREVGDRAGLATTLNNIAGVYSNLGQVEKALEFYNQALPITDEVGDRAGMATILNNIGMVHNSLDQRDKAIEFFNQALEILDEVENRPGLAATLNNIARAYYALGQPENALERFNRALAITNELGDRAGLAVLLNTIGNVYNSLGQRDTAMEIFNRTLPIMDEVGNQAGLIATLNDIAGVYFAVGQKDKALEFFSRALPIIDEAGDLFEEGATRYKMASVYISDGNLKDAEPHLQRAVEALTAAQAPELEMVQNTLTEVQDRLAEEGSVTD
ncbi:MAG: tetratricopeptide repeat protein, partial [SAR202 cluster bacterium]|nr:tetratricopeptide repeat protein [SAR202 cluster bacterium]